MLLREPIFDMMVDAGARIRVLAPAGTMTLDEKATMSKSKVSTARDERQWQVYTLSDPGTGGVRYVGWAHDARRRFCKHLADSKRETTHKANWIRGLLAEGLEPILDIIEEGFGESWIESEQRLIAHHRSLGADLTNHTSGGDGTPGYKVSDEVRALISRKKKGKPLPPEHRACLIAAHSGKPLSAEHRRKLSLARKGKAIPDEVRARWSAQRKGKPKQPFSAEHRANLAKAATGRKMGPWTEEHRRKVYKAKGIPYVPKSGGQEDQS